MLYQLLKSTHSLTAYIVLVVLCFAVINAALGVWQKRKYEKKDLRINLFALIFTHLQVTLGLILYFVTPLFQSWSAMGAGIRFGGVFRHCAGACAGVRGWAIWGIVRHIPECVLAGPCAGKSQVPGRGPSRHEWCGTGHVPGRKQQNNTSQEAANFP